MLLSHKPDSDELIEWFTAWKTRATEGRRKRNEAVHAWWLSTGEAQDPYKVLDVFGRKSRSRILENVIPGGSATLDTWINAISAISDD